MLTRERTRRARWSRLLGWVVLPLYLGVSLWTAWSRWSLWWISAATVLAWLAAVLVWAPLVDDKHDDLRRFAVSSAFLLPGCVLLATGIGPTLPMGAGRREWVLEGALLLFSALVARRFLAMANISVCLVVAVGVVAPLAPPPGAWVLLPLGILAVCQHFEWLRRDEGPDDDEWPHPAAVAYCAALLLGGALALATSGAPALAAGLVVVLAGELLCLGELLGLRGGLGRVWSWLLKTPDSGA